MSKGFKSETGWDTVPGHRKSVPSYLPISPFNHLIVGNEFFKWLKQAIAVVWVSGMFWFCLLEHIRYQMKLFQLGHTKHDMLYFCLWLFANVSRFHEMCSVLPRSALLPWVLCGQLCTSALVMCFGPVSCLKSLHSHLDNDVKNFHGGNIQKRDKLFPFAFILSLYGCPALRAVAEALWRTSETVTLMYKDIMSCSSHLQV